MPTLDCQDNVFVLDLGDTENRFHPDWIGSVNAALDEVEQAAEPRALVTAATGKFFSNGLDLNWLMAHGDQHHEYVVAVHMLFARVLSLPMATVAALQGHTFAAGAMLSLAHEFRVDPGTFDPADRARGHDHRPPLRRQGRPRRRNRRPLSG
jgi:Delta3-Delta2-enoyl-CoA isomerase